MVSYEEIMHNKHEKFDNFLKDLGIEKDVLVNFVDSTYDQFIRNTREEIAKYRNEGIEPPENLVIDNNISFQEYNENKQKVLEAISNFIEAENENEGKEDDFRFPYCEIFNGNFPKLDKTKLSDQAKVALKVDGLPDFAYDIYYNAEHKKAIPIYYDYSTVNHQWVEFSFMLEKMGDFLGININHKAPLITLNRMLLGIDIDNPVISSEIQIAAAIECEQNPIYMVREAGRIMDEATGERIPYEMTIATWTFLWLYAQRFNIYREQSRQTGKTFDLTKVLGMDWGAGLRNAKMLVVHFNQDEAGKNRRGMIDAANMLPRFLKFHTIKTKKVKGKQMLVEEEDFSPSLKAREVKNEERNNFLKIFAVGTSETQAERTGRGDSPRFVYVDEINFIRHTTAMLGGILFAHGTARLLAIRSNQRHGIYFTSTPGKLNTTSGRLMYELVFKEMAQFDIEFFGYTYEELCKVMNNSKKHFWTMSYEYFELGFNEAWLEKSINESNDREVFMTDMLNRWLEVDSESLYGQKLMGRVSKLAKETPHRTLMFMKNHKMTYFSHEDIPFEDYLRKFHAISIGVDIAFGGNDSSVVFIMDMETFQPILNWNTNSLDVNDFSFVCIKFFNWLREVNPNMIMVINPEVDGVGQIYMNNMRKSGLEPYLFRIDKHVDKNLDDSSFRFTNKKLSGNILSTFGTRQRSADTRKYITTELWRQLIDKYPYAFGNIISYSELGTLREERGGKINHKYGCHDDNLMATALAYMVAIKPDYRLSLEKNWNFIVDYSKIKVLSLTSLVNSHLEDTNYYKEGKIEYEIINYRGTDDKIYDKIIAWKWVNGSKVYLNDEEINEECLHGQLAGKEDIFNMRLPIMVTMLNTFNNTISSDTQMMGRARSVTSYNKYNKKDKRLW